MTSTENNKHFTNYADITDHFCALAGGQIAVSYHLNVQQYAIRQWRKRGVPEAHWVPLAKLAGVPVDDIWRAHRQVRGDGREGR